MPSGADRAEQRRQSVQPYRHSRCHYIAGEQGENADAYLGRYSPPVIAAAITSQHDKASLPTHIHVPGSDSGLVRDSIVLLEQIRTIDKRRLKERMGRLDDTSMAEIDTALTISFGLGHGTT